MKRYSISFSYSRDGKSWTITSTTVTASSQTAAISQIKIRYAYVKNVRVMSVH